MALIEATILLTGMVHGTMGAAGVGATAVVVGLNLGSLALAAHAPRAYAARWRTPLMTATRAANMILYPTAVDLLSIMSGRALPAMDAAAAAQPFASGAVAAAALYARGAAFFVIPVAGVHAAFLTALYFQLPPLAHVAVQGASMAALMRRTPAGAMGVRPALQRALARGLEGAGPWRLMCALAVTRACGSAGQPRLRCPPFGAPPVPSAVCSQFVAMHPAHARLAEAAHWVVRNVVALLCPGTWPTLEVAAEDAGPVEKCAAVAWTLEVGGRRRAGCAQAASRGDCRAAPGCGGSGWRAAPPAQQRHLSAGLRTCARRRSKLHRPCCAVRCAGVAGVCACHAAGVAAAAARGAPPGGAQGGAV